jgi:hypothetical protein
MILGAVGSGDLDFMLVCHVLSMTALAEASVRLCQKAVVRSHSKQQLTAAHIRRRHREQRNGGQHSSYGVAEANMQDQREAVQQEARPMTPGDTTAVPSLQIHLKHADASESSETPTSSPAVTPTSPATLASSARQTRLAELAKAGDDAEVARAIVAGAGADGFLEEPDVNGRTALQNACTAGHRGVVVKLLLAGANPTVRTDAGHSLMHLVARGSGSLDVAKRLLQKAPDLKTAKCNLGWTPLLYASEAGNWPLCDILDARFMNVASPAEAATISFVNVPSSRCPSQDAVDAKLRKLQAEERARRAAGEEIVKGAKDNVYRIEPTSGTIIGGL